MKSADGCVISMKLVRADRTSTMDVEGCSACRVSANDFTMCTMDVRACMTGTKQDEVVDRQHDAKPQASSYDEYEVCTMGTKQDEVVDRQQHDAKPQASSYDEYEVCTMGMKQDEVVDLAALIFHILDL